MPRKGEEAEYSLLFSCRPREYARAEVLQHCSSLEVNMERLARAGTLCMVSKQTGDDFKSLDEARKTVKDAPMPDGKSYKFFDQGEADFMDRLADNSVRLVLERKSAKDFVAHIEKKLKETTGKDPQVKLLGMHSTGAPLMIHCIDGKPATPWAFFASYMGADGQKQCSVAELAMGKPEMFVTQMIFPEDSNADAQPGGNAVTLMSQIFQRTPEGGLQPRPDVFGSGGRGGRDEAKEDDSSEPPTTRTQEEQDKGEYPNYPSN
uniref:Uncharacterized protein n=1 Tax=Chromera velia CCMP2878 TaxID=1169474 RepID=A0A0G4I9K6_9ALVE|eukprot:Cvel_12274.t1-p1 / transcript=Cvel_12274.t1 / gene=Cvel_12274 / organism=Chromera_velia_CCMP2878 / gene_product=hypothetical protein / transcript_product=hypothetical protein / location=Cvel_scaffold796:3144-3929(-) / protein_length=262 / sequence_SO=supercontig / SO=protein_coding / is_pseudo=false